ncbi:conserved hypothetical protein [Gammaproteobacteria bacterium]
MSISFEQTIPFPKRRKKDSKNVIEDPEVNKALCNGCFKCCMHINHQIDPPETDEDCDYIIWFLLHEQVSVWVDDNNDWFIEYRTPCKALKNGLCGIYERRPQVCREYTQDSCLNSNLEDDVVFNTPEVFLKYLKKETNYAYHGFYQVQKPLRWIKKGFTRVGSFFTALITFFTL